MRRLRMFGWVALGLMVLSQSACDRKDASSGSDAASSTTSSRSFEFSYGAVITDLEPGALAKVWIPVATSGHEQEVKRISTSLPDGFRETREQRFGNPLIYFEAKANEQGEIPIEVVYEVTRQELTPNNYEPVGEVNQSGLFLESANLVPSSDELREVILGADKPEGEAREVAKLIYEGVDDHMKYDKPADQPGWGNGDAVWACDSRFGNCTDFHSVFIASARNLKIPAKFEIGFPIPEAHGEGEVGGYHCWAKFVDDQHWVPVDISEADKHPELKDYYFGSLTADRVKFSQGRDLKLDPLPVQQRVNYLVYPYVEVEGVQHKSFRKAFRYRDLDE